MATEKRLPPDPKVGLGAKLRGIRPSFLPRGRELDKKKYARVAGISLLKKFLSEVARGEMYPVGND